MSPDPCIRPHRALQCPHPDHGRRRVTRKVKAAMFTAVTGSSSDEVIITLDKDKEVLCILVYGPGEHFHGFGVTVDLTDEVREQLIGIVYEWNRVECDAIWEKQQWERHLAGADNAS